MSISKGGITLLLFMKNEDGVLAKLHPDNLIYSSLSAGRACIYSTCLFY